MKDDIWDKFEWASADGYHEDYRWKLVTDLRKAGKQSEANGLVFKIREDWGLE